MSNPRSSKGFRRKARGNRVPTSRRLCEKWDSMLIAHHSLLTANCSLSVILIGCADDLVVPDPGRQYAGGSVCRDCVIRSSPPPFAEVARISRRNPEQIGPRPTHGPRQTLMLHRGELSMTRSAVQALRTPQERTIDTLRQAAIVVCASFVVAVCAHITIPLMPLTPVPLTVQNLAVLLVGLLLGSRRGFAALLLYLVEGISGLPVFNPTGPGMPPSPASV